MKHAVKLSGVGRRFGTHWAIAHLTFEVERGCVVVLTGSNGAGKTTLLRVLATALRPTLGELRLFGTDAASNPSQIRSRLALLTHDSHLYSDLSGYENLALLARLLKRPRHLVSEALERVGLSEAANQAVRGYSAGMKRRVGLARVLLSQPELVLLDEPFGQLDPEGVALMEEVVQQLHARGATVFLSTHDVERGLKLADQHLVMKAGQTTGLVPTTAA
ncbi:MAG: heme ABC exporter ATP-binding protein CcmA [Myxococcota bacterium]